MKFRMGTLDDMNHLKNKSIRSVADLLRDQFVKNKHDSLNISFPSKLASKRIAFQFLTYSEKDSLWTFHPKWNLSNLMQC